MRPDPYGNLIRYKNICYHFYWWLFRLYFGTSHGK